MSKKRVATLTFHRAVNYGAVLQAYALQTVIKENGYDTEILDYRNSEIESIYKPITNLKSPKVLVRDILTFSMQNKRNKNFSKFLANNINLSSKSYDRANVRDCCDLYDSIVVGSDQMWNLCCVNYDKTYFLDFVKDSNKKKSYAVSMGKIADCKDDYGEYLPLIEDFKNISLREQAGKEFLQNNGINKNIDIDIDPVFLLSKGRWQKLEKKVDVFDYAMIYSVNLTEDVINAGRKYAKDNNLKLVFVTLRKKKINLLSNELNLSACSPDEFVYLIDNAKCVITNSFHGTAFSIIMETDFWTIKNKKAGLDNSRMDTLLDTFNLSSRHLLDINKICDSKVDFQSVSEILDTVRESSKNRLLESIK